MMKQAEERLEGQNRFRIHANEGESDDRLSKHTQGEWSTKYVKEGELYR